MAATIPAPDASAHDASSAATSAHDAGPSLLRFDGVERGLHWCNAVLFAVLVFTGATLYLSPLQELIGRRALVEEVHVYTGIALPVPLLLAVAGRWGAGLRADLRRWNRWTGADRAWLRTLFASRVERQAALVRIEAGKFNAGQKLNASFVAGAGLVMLATGIVMRWYSPWPLPWRTGATFVHDWLALALGLVIIGHVAMALASPEALRSMITGRISREWARRHAPAWLHGDDGPVSPGQPGKTAHAAQPAQTAQTDGTGEAVRAGRR